MFRDCPEAVKRTKITHLAALLAAFAMLFLVPSQATGQTGQGSISGQVTDKSGARVPQANVTITSEDTGIQQKTVTNNAGVYNVLSLNPGNYTVEVAAKGFSKEIVNKIIVSGGAAVETNVHLTVGQADMTVTVTTEADLLSSTSDVATTVDHEIVENLPYPERSSLEAVLLVPGVNGDSFATGGVYTENAPLSTGLVTPGASIQVGGSVAGTTTILVDGSDVMQASYPRAGVNLSGREVQETTAITSGLSAKYGRSSTGAIIQNSKAGSSAYHGALTWRHTDPFFNATPAGDQYKNDQHENYYGAYIGGPVQLPKIYNKNWHTFFYAGYEPARLRTFTGLRGIFLTPDETNGIFYNAPTLLNTTCLKYFGYAAALAFPRNGQATTYSTGTTAAPTCSAPGVTNGSSLQTSYALTNGGTNQNCPVYNNTGFPCGTNSGSAVPFTGPIGDCAAAYALSPNPGAATCVDDMSQQLAQNPFAKYVMSLMPTPSNPGPYMHFDNAMATSASDGTNGTYTRGVFNTDNRYSIRIDQQFNNSNTMFVRYTVIPVIARRIFALALDNPLTQTPTDSAHTHDIAIGYTHILSNTMVNNFRYSLMRNFQQRVPPAVALTKDYASSYGLTPASLGKGFPTIQGNVNGTLTGANGLLYTLNPGTGGNSQVDQNFILGDDVSWTHGTNLFQFGVDIRWIQSSQYNPGNAYGGVYQFSTAGTSGSGSNSGEPWASFDLGVPTNFTNVPIPVNGYYRWRYYAGYFQDDWRITPTITLNLGLRYDVETPRREKFNNQAFFIPGGLSGGTPNGTAATSAFCFSGTCGLGKTIWHTNFLGFEPRFGVSVALTHKTTVRSSYTLVRMPLSGYNNVPDPNFNVAGNSITNITGGVNPSDETDLISNPVAPVASSLANLVKGPNFYSTGFSPEYVSQSNAVPYMQSYSLAFQYQPFQKTLLQATYQGTRGNHLIGLATPLNVPSLTTTMAGINAGVYFGGTGANPYGIKNPGQSLPLNETALQALNPYQNFFNQAINQIYQRVGVLKYNALYLSINQRANRYITIIASYTWSKQMDNVPDATQGTMLNSTNISGLQSPIDRSTDYSVSAFDQASRFKAGYNASLPFGKGQRWVSHSGLINRIIGGFSTGGVVNANDGLPNYVTLGTAGYFYSVSPIGMGGTKSVTPAGTFTTGGCPVSSTVTVCNSSGLPGGYSLRPSFVPGQPIINKNFKQNPYNALNGTISSYLNPAAFMIPGSPGNPEFGNVPRFMSNARSPRQFIYDMRFVKAVPINHRYTLNVNATMNDVFNHQLYNGIALTNHTLFSANGYNQNPSAVQSVYPCAYTSCSTGTAATLNANFGNLNGGAASRVIRVGAELIF